MQTATSVNITPHCPDLSFLDRAQLKLRKTTNLVQETFSLAEIFECSENLTTLLFLKISNDNAGLWRIT